MRPSIRGMLDCTIRIWRPVVTKDTLGVETRTYIPMITVDAFINRPMQPLANMGAGLAPTGGTRWYGLPTIDVRPRDVCEVMSGPETGKTFEVNAPPVRPKNHHTQVDCIEWHGTLPDLGTDSGVDSGTDSGVDSGTDSGGDPFLDGLSAQSSLLRAWKPDVLTQTMPDHKGIDDFAMVDPLNQGIVWTEDIGGGDIVGFGIGQTGDENTSHAVTSWPALEFFSLHFLFKSGLVAGASNTPFGVEQDTGDPADLEIMELAVWTNNDPTNVGIFPAAVGFSYVDAADEATGTEQDMWYQADPGDPTQPAPDVLTDVCVSLGSDGMARVWQNGVLILETLATGALKKLWNPATVNKLFTGNGYPNGDGTRWFDNEYYLGPVVLYDDAITTADVIANRELFKLLGYTSLP